MGEGFINLGDWFADLFVSQNFWGTILGAIVGGLFALKIAKDQVKSSEENQEKQRKEIVNHEKKMELVRIQLKESNKSIGFISKLPDLLLEVSLLTYKILESSGDVLKIQNEKAQMISSISFRLLELESSARICDLSESGIEDCIKLREITYKMFDDLLEDDLLEQLKNGVSKEEFIKNDIKNIPVFSETVEKVNNNFAVCYEKLIHQFKNILS